MSSTAVYKASEQNALYAGAVALSGEVRVSSRGQMSLPASARSRWGLADGGELGYIDVGEFVILMPGGVKKLRRQLLEQMTDEDWAEARRGFGDADLANE